MDTVRFDFEMVEPAVSAWIVEAGKAVVDERTDVAPFGSIAGEAREGEVRFVGGAAMLETDDVVGLAVVQAVVLVNKAILTEILARAC